MKATSVAALVSEDNSDSFEAFVGPSMSPTPRASKRQLTATQHGNRLQPTQPPPEGGGSQRFRLFDEILKCRDRGYMTVLIN